MDVLESNIDDIALIFEGGGMRASYTSGAVNVLLENKLHFDHVYGLSAGSSNAVNYLSRDIWRTKVSFTDIVDDPRFGGWGTWLARKGLFSADYIYQESCRPGCKLPFDFETFANNPAKITVQGFERDTGNTLYWPKDQMPTLNDLMVRVQASSSLPIVMPPPLVDGSRCYDGGLGVGAGLMLPRAIEDGFERFFVVCTRPRGYRKGENTSPVLDAFFWRRPYVREALHRRPREYNRQLDLLDKLEKEGRAYVFYADEQMVDSGERNLEKLRDNYRKGYAQAQRELPGWAKFLNK